jgi:phosphonate transport system substrate-binding protein
MRLRTLLCALYLLSLPVHADITVGLLTTRADEQTLEDWQPILNDLSAAIGQPVKGWVSSDRDALLRKIQNNEIQIARVDNKLALDAVETGKSDVFASLIQSGNLKTYRSVMLVRKDSPIQNAEQLLDQPKKLRYAAGKSSSMADCYIPQYHLFMKNNILPEQYFKQIIIGTTEQSFTALAKSQVDVAVSNSFDLEQLKEKYPRDFSQMRIVWQSPEFTFDPLILRRDLPAQLKAKINQFFLDYGRIGSNTALAKQRLYYADQLAGFTSADNRSLRQVTDLQLFHDLFRFTLNTKLDPKVKTAQEKAYYARYNQLVALLGGAK